MIQSKLPELKTRYEWHYIDMEEFIQELWGQKWEGSAALGFSAQDTYHDFEVTGGYIGEGIDSEGNTITTRWMDEEYTYDQAKELIEKFKIDGMPREEYANPGAELLLNWLAFEGHIPTGNYRIIVWW